MRVSVLEWLRLVFRVLRGRAAEVCRQIGSTAEAAAPRHDLVSRIASLAERRKKILGDNNLSAAAHILLLCARSTWHAPACFEPLRLMSRFSVVFATGFGIILSCFVCRCWYTQVRHAHVLQCFLCRQYPRQPRDGRSVVFCGKCPRKACLSCQEKEVSKDRKEWVSVSFSFLFVCGCGCGLRSLWSRLLFSSVPVLPLRCCRRRVLRRREEVGVVVGIGLGTSKLEKLGFSHGFFSISYSRWR